MGSVIKSTLFPLFLIWGGWGLFIGLTCTQWGKIDGLWIFPSRSFSPWLFLILWGWAWREAWQSWNQQSESPVQRKHPEQDIGSLSFISSRVEKGRKYVDS